jgi:GT2 family glycosyltransferase
MFSVENHSHPADLNSDRATSGIAACTISVIIPNLNGLSYLSSCLKSVFAQEIPGYALEVFVIDNCSTDGSLDAVHEQFPQVEVIANAENRGFTQAINQGIEASRGEYLLLLNNDVVVCSGALLMLTTELRDGPADLAGVQPLMLSAQDTSVVDSAGISLLPHFQACDFLHGHALAEASEEKQEIWGTCFGCALIKRSVFHQCGHLDPDFFAMG